MTNPEEFAICKRRGHETAGLERERWLQCVHCGVWLREKVVVEEREDTPPKNEISIFNDVAKRAKKDLPPAS